MIRLTIDGRDVETSPGTSVLDAALDAGIYVPHLCHHPDLPPGGVCQLCVVEIDGADGLVASCATLSGDGMVVRTQSYKISRLRRLAVELLLIGHPPECGTCEKYLNCELQSLKQYLGVEELRFPRRPKLLPVNSSNPLFVYDPNKCVLCGRCVRACSELRDVGVLQHNKRGGEFVVYASDGMSLADAGCRFCGACAEVCPTGAIQDKDELLKDKNRKAALVPCKSSCPAEIDVPRYVRFIKDGDLSAAVATIREKVPFPLVLGYVCDHPCETRCRRGEINEPVSIRELKRFAAEHDDGDLWKKNLVLKPASEKHVAVIGSGPAGLTAAYYLRLRGHEVTVFESLPAAGGMLRYGIPEYRLPRSILDREIQAIKALEVEIRIGTSVDSIDMLFEQGFDAVVVAVGAHQGQRLRIPGAGSEEALVGTEFLKALSLGENVTVGKRVIVLGGGNVAFDCARVARRLGAEEVRIACVECRDEMPASADEIRKGEDEGIAIDPSHTATRIVNGNGGVTGVEFLDVETFYFDEHGVPQLETVKDSEHLVDADTVIFAIGQRPDVPERFGIDRTDRGLVELDPLTLSTNRDGVFAAGDAVSGTASAIQAIASGRKAAIAVDKFLGGSGRIDQKLAPEVEPGPRIGKREGFAAMTRSLLRNEVSRPARPGGRGFVLQQPPTSSDSCDGAYESERCLQCDLRLKIKTVKFWGNY